MDVDATGQEVAAPGLGRRLYLAAEFGVLFFGLVVAYDAIGSPGSPIPVLVVGAAAAAIYLRRQPAFDRRSFFRAAALRRHLPSILLLWVLAFAVAWGALAVFSPERLFVFPREQPLVWAMVMVFYPLLSAYPQELIFRGYVFHRYFPVFGSGGWMVVASAVAFGFVHLIFGNVISVVLSAIGGVLFGIRYLRSRSLLTVAVEHGLYGMLIFTIGLGQFFFHGATPT